MHDFIAHPLDFTNLVVVCLQDVLSVCLAFDSCTSWMGPNTILRGHWVCTQI